MVVWVRMHPLLLLRLEWLQPSVLLVRVIQLLVSMLDQLLMSCLIPILPKFLVLLVKSVHLNCWYESSRSLILSSIFWLPFVFLAVAVLLTFFRPLSYVYFSSRFLSTFAPLNLQPSHFSSLCLISPIRKLDAIEVMGKAFCVFLWNSWFLFLFTPFWVSHIFWATILIFFSPSSPYVSLSRFIFFMVSTFWLCFSFVVLRLFSFWKQILFGVVFLSLLSLSFSS